MDRPATTPPTTLGPAVPTPAPPPADRTPFRPVRPRPPGAVTAATWLWVAAAVAGTAAAGLALPHVGGRRRALARSLLAGDHSRDAAQTAHVAAVAIDAALVWVVALAILSALLLRPARRSAKAATALFVVGIAQLAATALVPALLSPPGWGPRADVRWTLLAQAVLVGAGVVALALPASRSWRRR